MGLAYRQVESRKRPTPSGLSRAYRAYQIAKFSARQDEHPRQSGPPAEAQRFLHLGRYLAGRRPVSNTNSTSRDSVQILPRYGAGGGCILVTTSFLNYIHTAALHRYSPCLVSPQRTPLASTTPLAKGTQALTHNARMCTWDGEACTARVPVKHGVAEELPSPCVLRHARPLSSRKNKKRSTGSSRSRPGSAGLTHVLLLGHLDRILVLGTGQHAEHVRLRLPVRRLRLRGLAQHHLLALRHLVLHEIFETARLALTDARLDLGEIFETAHLSLNVHSGCSDLPNDHRDHANNRSGTPQELAVVLDKLAARLERRLSRARCWYGSARGR